MKTIITPPKFLHDIHGSTTTLFDMLITYSGGIIAMIGVYLLSIQNSLEIPIWKLSLLLIVSADIGAGVIANFTKGTNSYYGGKDKRKSRLVFILSHFLHPTIFLYTLELFSYKTIILVVLVILLTLIINSIKDKEKQKVIASLCLLLGLSSLLIIEIGNPFLLWFFPLFMIKLFIAFSIRRY